MKVLVVLHGMPPQAGRTVVGAGLRAYANGESLRQRGHRVYYATRAEDLPDAQRVDAEARRKKKPLLLTTITGSVEPPGQRQRRRLTAVGPAPVTDEVPRPSLEFLDAEQQMLDSGFEPPPNQTAEGIARLGGGLGSAGQPFSFTEAFELHEIVQRVDPDVVLLEALEEARRLPDGRFSVILDLFAPRILEQQFQEGDDERDAVRVLDAIQRADSFVFSNERQKYFHLPLLALAGVDCTQDAGVVVPISCPPDFPPPHKPELPVFVAGGVFWPWADLSSGLASLLSVLDERGEGELHLYGGRYDIRSDTSRYADPRRALPEDHPRVTFKGLVPINELWHQYSRASLAFDLMAPNPEREINLSFRQIDYLRCGLPIITSPRQVIASDLLDYGAGWCVDPTDTRALQELVGRLLDEPGLIAAASAAAQRLAREKYAWDRTSGPLDQVVRHPIRRSRTETLIGRLTRTQGDLLDDHEQNKRLRELLVDQRGDLGKKTEEIATLNGRIGTLMGSVDRLGESLQEVSRFKNEAVAYLQEQQGETSKETVELGRELERRSLDLKKKQDALARATRELAKLKLSITELCADNEQLEARFVARDREALGFEEDRRRAVDEAQRQRDQIEAFRQDLRKKEAELADVEAQRSQDLEELRERLDSALSADAHSSADADVLRGQLEETRAELAAVRAESVKKGRESERLREQIARQSAEAASAFETARADALEQLERAEQGATRVAEQLRDRLAKLDTERGRLTARLAESTHRVADLERDLETKQRQATEAKKLADDELRRHEDEAARIDTRHQEATRETQAEAQERLEGVQRRFELASAQRDAALDQLASERARVTDLEADIGKKTAGLEQAGRERQRLEANFLRSLDKAESAARGLLERARDRIAELEDERGAAQAKLEELGHRVRDLERSGREKDAALSAAEADRARLELEFLGSLDRAEAAARDELGRARDGISTLEGQRGQLKAALDEARGRARDLEREVDGRDVVVQQIRRAAEQAEARHDAAAFKAEQAAAERLQEVREAAEERTTAASAAATEARAQLDRVAGKLAVAEGRASDLAADAAKKTEALKQAAAERDRLQEDFLGALQRAEVGSHELLERAHDAVAALTQERGQLRSRSEELQTRVRDLEREVAGRDRALAQQQRRFDEAEARFEAEHLRNQQQGDDATAELRDLAESRVQTAQAALSQTRTERDRLADQLAVHQNRLNDVEADLGKKDAALQELTVDRERSERERAEKLAEERKQAAALLDEARARANSLEANNGSLQARLERAVFEASESDRAAKSEAARRLAAEKDKERAETSALRALEVAEERALALAEELRGRLQETERERLVLSIKARELTGKLGDTARRLALREEELGALQRQASEAEAEWNAERNRVQLNAEERIREAHSALVQARQQRDTTRDEMLRVQSLSDDLKADVDKKSSALQTAHDERNRLQEEFLGSLERAQGASKHLLEEAQDRVHRLTTERGRLQAYVEELQEQGNGLEREVSTKDVALTSAQDRLQDEREQYQMALVQLEELRAVSQSSSCRLVEVEAEVARNQSALATLSGEYARMTGQLEEVQFESSSLESELTKKNREITETQSQRDEAWTKLEALKLEAEATRQATLAEAARLAALAEEQGYELEGLRREVEKKTLELEDAWRQRDEVTTEKKDLRGELDHTLRQLDQLRGAPEPKKTARTKKRSLLSGGRDSN